ncbi:MAG: RAMP superfamily CRISPR-associated protein [Anaerolineae bacterium]
MSIRLEFDIKFKSDYHIGAGHGLGLQVDSALLRDPDNVPVIRGTVLAGLLRESLTDLLNLGQFSGKQHTGDEDNLCLACSIFGTPGHKKRWRVSSARPAGLAAPQAPSGGWRPGETAAQTTTRVRVNPRTRRAEESKLFSREEGDGSLHFRFVVECDNDDDAALHEAEWLVAAARMLRNLGAGKHRGYGECDIHLVDLNKETAILGRFAQRLRDEPVEEPVRGVTETAIEPLDLPADPGQHAYRLQVLIRLDEPLLVARRSEAGNQFETLDTIPGSVLRGALAWRIAQRLAGELKPDSVVYQNFAGLFFGDLVHFSALMPLEVRKENPSTAYRTILAPRDLVTCELHAGYPGHISHRGHGVWSLIHDNRQECPICAAEDTASGRKAASVKLETLDGFVSLVGGAPRSKHKPKQTMEMHIRIDPASGRVRTGDLYGYVALEPGQYFVGEIACTDANVWQVLRTMADLQAVGEVNELKLGKATQRGYGKISAVFTPIDKPLLHIQSLGERLNSTEGVTMLLLSDAVMSDPWGRFWQGFDPAWLKRALRLPPEVEVSIDRSEDCEALAFSAARTVDAFNAKLGLPRTRDVAIVAGSSARLSFTGIDVQALAKLLEDAEMQGIGLRRDEGFGRVAFNHPVYRQMQGVASQKVDLSPLTLGSTSHPSVAVLQFALDWLKHLEEQRLTNFNDERFEAVARLLHASRHTSADAIEQEMQRLGEQGELLAQPLKGRDKKNFFEKEGKPGMDDIAACLDEMAKQLKERSVPQDAQAQAWRIGLQLLAARIAGPARQKAQERR